VIYAGVKGFLDNIKVDDVTRFEKGLLQEVRGPGVVGAQPVIGPGESFEYTSGCPLPTASGHMVGRYQMKAASGEAFEAEIPPFILESPHERRQVH